MHHWLTAYEAAQHKAARSQKIVRQRQLQQPDLPSDIKHWVRTFCKQTEAIQPTCHVNSLEAVTHYPVYSAWCKYSLAARVIDTPIDTPFKL